MSNAGPLQCPRLSFVCDMDKWCTNAHQCPTKWNKNYNTLTCVVYWTLSAEGQLISAIKKLIILFLSCPCLPHPVCLLVCILVCPSYRVGLLVCPSHRVCLLVCAWYRVWESGYWGTGEKALIPIMLRKYTSQKEKRGYTVIEMFQSGKLPRINIGKIQIKKLFNVTYLYITFLQRTASILKRWVSINFQVYTHIWV